MKHAILVDLCLISLIAVGLNSEASDRPEPNPDSDVAESAHFSGRQEERVQSATLWRARATVFAGRLSSYDIRSLHTNLDTEGESETLSLTSGDFDEDGVPDLVCGRATFGGGFVTLQKGNVDSVFPISAEANKRRVEDTNSDKPFLSTIKTFAVRVRPDILGAGDFDNDGHRDVVVGSIEGSSLLLLAGDGKGELRDAGTLTLPGRLTAMIVGDVNRRDGLADFVAAIVGPDGPATLVFEGFGGAFHSKPEALPLPAPATSLALGPLNSYAAFDLVIGTERQLLIVEGRDRKTYLGPERQEQVDPPEVVRIDLTGTIRDVAAGDFTLDTEGHEVAVLFGDGSLQLLGRFETTDEWTVVREQNVGGPSAARRSLHAARISGSLTDDLVVLDAVRQRLTAVGGGAVLGAVDLEAPPVAVLPMRLNQDAKMDLVVVEQGKAPRVALSSPDATITVDTASDTSTAGDGSCSLREAITNANGDTDTTGGDCAAGGGSDLVSFDVATGGFTVPIALTSALPDIVDSVTIDGDTQACASEPCIELRGAVAGVGVNGLTLTAWSSTIRGLVIREFDGDGISLLSAGNFVEDNFIGTDQTGRDAAGNAGSGVYSEGADNTIGGTAPEAGNLISGNGDVGIRIHGPTGAANVVQGNLVGTDVSGSADLGNTTYGIVAEWSPGNVIGGTTAAARNVFSGNDNSGAWLEQPDTTGNLFQGNFVGTSITGLDPLGSAHGVVVLYGAEDNTIGGAAVGARNLVSDNDWGVVAYSGATGTLVAGNYLGTDLNGASALGNFYAGVQIEAASGNIVGGASPALSNLISGNTKYGVVITGASGPCSDNQVLGNLIGTDRTGTVDLGNDSAGILINDASTNSIGGAFPGMGNLISGNNEGIIILNPSSMSTLNEILGNLIGTDITGAIALGNTWDGIDIRDSPLNVIGGTSAGARNVISGNTRGIVIQADGGGGSLLASSNRILGNYIGTDHTGTIDLGNLDHGVVVQSSNNTVGGSVPGARNVISGNNGVGLWLREPEATDNQVLGNYIGVDVSGAIALGNGGYAGVTLSDGASGNTIGGTAKGATNVISGNGTNGVAIVALGGEAPSGNEVVGNFIGTDVTGKIPLGNDNNGVIIEDSSNNVVGGTSAGAGNLIAGNEEHGIAVFESTPGTTLGNALLGNSIVSNVGMGIDHSNDGVTTNDSNDPDLGPNLLQNFPVLTSVEATPAGVTVDGTYNSHGNSQFRLEFFTNTECDPSGCGEGERYLGFQDVLTDLFGDAIFSVTLPALVSDGDSITATATDFANNTSEFADCLTAECQSLATLNQTIEAADKDTLIWASASDVHFAKGDLSDISSYMIAGEGSLLGSTSLDISSDSPGAGTGLYYIVRPLGCGSWQNAIGSESARDLVLP